MSYREYMPGWCQNPKCQKDLGLVAQGGGRDRKYCDNRCKTQAARIRQKEKESLEMVYAVKRALSEGWQLDEETMRLVARLGEYGPDAIREGIYIATKIVESYRRRAEKKGVFL